jgi:hypothetical protein
MIERQRLPIQACALRRPQRFVGDGVEPGAAEARGSRVEQANVWI